MQRNYLNKISLLAMLVSLVFGTSTQAEEAMSQRQKLDIVMACERVEHDYAIYRDRRDAEAFANIFTEDGQWGRSNGRVLQGREAIADYVRGLVTAAENAPPEYEMQFTTTVQITPTSATTATGISYALILEAPAPADGGRGIISGPFKIGSESRSVYEITDQGCKIAHREYTTYFHAAE